MQHRVWAVVVLAIAGMVGVSGTAAAFTWPTNQPVATAKPKSTDLKKVKAACEAQDLNTAIAGCTQLIKAKPKKAELADAYFKRGKAYDKRDEEKNALADFSKAIDLQPKFAKASLWKAAVEHSADFDEDRFIAAIDAILQVNPDFTGGRVFKGWALYRKGDKASAKAEFDIAIKLLASQFVGEKTAELLNERGDAFRGKEEYERAIADYNEALRLKPDFDEAYIKLGNAYFQKEDYDHALSAFTDAIGVQPDYVDAYASRAAAYRKKQAWDKAIADYDAAISRNPAGAVLYDYRGACLREKGDNERAADNFRKAIELNPKLADAYIGLALIHRDKKEWDQAIENFKAAVALKPSNEGYLNLLGIAYRLKGDSDSAMVSYEKALVLNPKLADAHVGKAILFRDKKDYDAAIAETNAAIAIEPENANHYNSLGSIYADKADFDLALASYDKSLALKPNLMDSHLGKAIIYRDKHQYYQQIDELGQALQIELSHAFVYLSRAWTYVNLGEYDRALNDFSEAIRLDPKHAQAYLSRGQLADSHNDYVAAIPDFTKAVALFKDGSQRDVARSSLISALVEKGDYGTALEIISGWFHEAPPNALHHVMLARIYHFKSDNEKALEHISEAIRLNPTLGTSYSTRASIYVSMGKYDLALADADKAIELMPDFVIFYSLRAQIHLFKNDHVRMADDCSHAIRIADKGPLDFSADIYALCAAFYRGAGNYDQSLAYYNEALRLRPNDPSKSGYLAGKAATLKETGDFDSAMASADEAIKKAPDNPDGYVQRGYAYLEKSKLDDALADFSKAVQLNPQTAYNPLIGRASVYAKKREYERAIEDFSAAILIDPVSPKAYYYRANAHRDRGDHEAALKDYNKALSLPVADAKLRVSYRYDRGLAFLWQGGTDTKKLDLAVADFDETLRLNPKYGLAYVARAEAYYLMKGKLDEALADANEALKIGKRSELAHAVRGDILRELNRLPEALLEFDQAIKLGAALPSVYFGRGWAYEREGRVTPALLDYQKAVALDADDPFQQDAKLKAQVRLAVLETQRVSPSAGLLTPVKATSGHRIALVIGESDYRHLGKLKNPANDARAVAQALRQFGFDGVQEVIDANRATLASALADFAERAASANWAVVFYAGHGFQWDGANYLIPVDAKLESSSTLDGEALNAGALIEAAAKAKTVSLVMLDACRNDAAFERVRQARSDSRGITVIAPSGLARVAAPKGSYVVFATLEDHSAADGAGEDHSPFTKALIENIDQPFDLAKLFSKVHDDVIKATHNEQAPTAYGLLPFEDLYFKYPG